MEKDKLRCSICGSKFTYARIKSGEIVCRRCGAITKIKKEDDK